MPNFVLIAVGVLVPILALALAFACGRARDAADETSVDINVEGLADEASS